MTRRKGDSDEEYRAKRVAISRRWHQKQSHRTNRWDRTDLERFWEKVDKNGPIPVDQPELGPCHVWIAAKRDYGYGAFRIGGRTVKAHRWLSEQVDGPIPDGIEVMHRCDNPPCVRLSHLCRGSHGQNMAEMAKRKRWGGPRNFPRGDDHWQRRFPERRLSGSQSIMHREPWRAVRGEQSGRSKITEEDVRSIRSARASGQTGQSLASKYGVSGAAISAIFLRKTWRHVDG